LIPLLMAATLTVLATAAVLAFPTAAQEELDRYLGHDRIPPVEVRTIVPAKLPWRFGDEFGYQVFGDSWCFHTDVRYSHETEAYPTPMLPQVFDDNMETFADGRPSLPFPPEEVWCVQLHGEDGGQVVFVARHHREPYCTSWVVHHGPEEPYGHGFLDTLSGIGCDLGLHR
jgi:hypothetical protein